LYIFIYFLPAIYICHIKQKDHIHSIVKTFFSFWFLLALIVPYIIPVFSLPSPEGKDSVGTETFHWGDSSRLEWFTEEKSNDYREIMVQVWYPGSNHPNKKVEPYMDFIKLRSKTIAAAGNLPSFFPSHLNLVKTNSYLEIPCKNKKSGLPIVVFSHGITGSRHLHQTLFEHLSSQGYVVVALDHSYDCNLTIFPDGRVADYRSEITGHPDSIKIRNQQIMTRTKDIIFVLNQITKIHHGDLKSKLNGKLNLEKIAVGGHSYGGATAIHSAKTDKRIKTCFVLDGWINPIPKTTIEQGLQKPILSMGRPSWKESDYPDNYNLLNQLFSNSSAPSYNIIIKNTLHLDYTDIPLYSPIIKYVMDVGDLQPATSQKLINNLIFTFLESHLLDKPMGDYNILLNNNLVTKM
jgi:pimeloyl-ACP methyl ester carboxylesterase